MPDPVAHQAQPRRLIAVAAWLGPIALAAAGCPIVSPASEQIRFTCVETDDCAQGQVCFEKQCYDPGQVPVADAATPLDGAGRDRLADAASEAGPDAAADAARDAAHDAGADAARDASQDGASDAATDAAVDAATLDGPARDAPALDAGDAAVVDAPGSDAAGQDRAAGDAGGCPADWWNCGWTDRVKLTFDNSQQGTLQNFPVMVRLNARRVDYARLQPDGEDVRFVDADGRTLLDHEVEKWVDNSEGIYWVRVPQIDASSTSDHIWLYYGNAATHTAEHAAGVWDSNFRAVWHLNSLAASSVAGPPAGSVTGGWAAAGLVGAGKNFNGSSDNILFSQAPSVLGSLTSLTVSAWIKPTALFAGFAGIVSTRNQSENDFSDGNWVCYLDRDQVGFEANSVAFPPNNGGPLDTLLDWHLVTVVLQQQSGRVRWYIDGRQVYNQAATIPTYADQDNVVIGARYYFGGLTDYFKGVIDEVRVSAAPRAADWLRAEYLTATDAFIQWPETAWWDAAYQHRLRVDFHSQRLVENLVDFPVLVELNAGALTWGDVKSSGADLRFVDPEGTALPYQITGWSHGARAAIWVKVPQINAYNSTDHIWMYYGNAAATAPANAAATWNSNFLGVYHLDGDALNATAGMHDGAASNVTVASGIVGTGYDFERQVGDAVVIADSGNLDDMAAQFSITAWVRPRQPTLDWQAFVSRENGASTDDLFWLGIHGSGLLWRNWLGTAAVDVTWPGPLVSGTWLHVAGAYNGRRLLLLVNGALVSETAADGVQPNGNQEVAIGANSNDNGATWDDNLDGIVDEVRFSKTMRSLAWIDAERRSVASGNLVGLGSEQSP
jgi:hypothetical protein